MTENRTRAQNRTNTADSVLFSALLLSSGRRGWM
jgi:hypothetical protein